MSQDPFESRDGVSNRPGSRIPQVSEVLERLSAEFGHDLAQRPVLFQAALRVCAEESRRAKRGLPVAPLEVMVERARDLLLSPRGQADLEAARSSAPPSGALDPLVRPQEVAASPAPPGGPAAPLGEAAAIREDVPVSPQEPPTSPESFPPFLGTPARALDVPGRSASAPPPSPVDVTAESLDASPITLTPPEAEAEFLQELDLAALPRPINSPAPDEREPEPVEVRPVAATPDEVVPLADQPLEDGSVIAEEAVAEPSARKRWLAVALALTAVVALISVGVRLSNRLTPSAPKPTAAAKNTTPTAPPARPASEPVAATPTQTPAPAPATASMKPTEATPAPPPAVAAPESTAAKTPPKGATTAKTAPTRTKPAPSTAAPVAKPPAGWAQSMVSPDWSGKAGNYVVHFSSFQEKRSAEVEARKVATRFGRPAYAAGVEIEGRGTWYRVVVGDFASAADARAFREEQLANKVNVGAVYFLTAQ